ncbi:hypothetical protein AAMO2058_000550900 [Amorphochlora amoebiformis]
MAPSKCFLRAHGSQHRVNSFDRRPTGLLSSWLSRALLLSSLGGWGGAAKRRVGQEVFSTRGKEAGVLDNPLDISGKWLVADGIRYVTPYYRVDEHRMKPANEGLKVKHVLCNMLTPNNSNLAVTFWSSKVRGGGVSLRQSKKSIDDPWEFRPLVDPDYCIQRGDTLQVRHHIHEKCVSDGLPVTHLDTDPDYLIVNKPSGVPMVNDNNGKNSVLYMVENSLKVGKRLYYTHRLDSPVSGILVLARNKAACKAAQREIANRRVSKLYIARFNMTPDQKVLFDQFKTEMVMHPRSRPLLSTPIPPLYIFLRYDQKGNTSLVRCFPKTGRPHQIRAHLRYLGHPIANDVIYGGRKDKSNYRTAYSSQACEKIKDVIEKTLESDCPRCEWISMALNGEIPDSDKPKVCIGIWLHAVRYHFPGLNRTFEVPPPEWATSFPHLQL